MKRTRTLITSTAVSIVVAVVVAACTAAADDSPRPTAATDCAVQCVENLIVTPAAHSATVEIQTTVTASVTVYANPKPPKYTDIDLRGVQRRIVHLVVPGGATWTASLPDLKPGAEYSVRVQATDLHGHSFTRVGMFTTLPVKTYRLELRR